MDKRVALVAVAAAVEGLGKERPSVVSVDLPAAVAAQEREPAAAAVKKAH